MYKVYILLCEEGKYYIGMTRRKVEDRFKEHILGIGSEWTKRYKPIKIIKEIENADEFDEDKWTKKYMKQYGIENVRGGSYCTIKLDNFTKSILEREICTIENRCFLCNENGHYIKECEWYMVKSSDYSRQNESFISKFWRAMGEEFK